MMLIIMKNDCYLDDDVDDGGDDAEMKVFICYVVTV